MTPKLVPPTYDFDAGPYDLGAGPYDLGAGPYDFDAGSLFFNQLLVQNKIKRAFFS